jgi:DNA replication protein DnaC
VNDFRCPIRGCSRSFADDHELYDHLTGRHHELDSDDANEHCKREWRRHQHAKLRTGRNLMWNWTLETFPADDVTGRRALKAAREWLAAEGERPWPSRVFIDGPPGTGKTGLAWSIAREWIDDPNGECYGEVEFENVRALLEEQRARFDRGEPKAIGHLLDGDTDRLVVLDDLGAERPTEWALETIALIVERLHATSTPMIVTTNYSPSALAARWGRADPVAGERIVSRLLDGAVRIRLDRQNLRAVRRVA